MYSETDSNLETDTSFLSSTTNNENITSSKSQPGPKRRVVWQHFEQVGVKNSGHQGCKCKYCNWSQKSGKPNLMEAHLALNCHKVSKEIKNIYLNLINNRDNINNNKQQLKKQKLDISKGKKLDDFYRPATINFETVKLANRALVKFFVCYKILFLTINHPFFHNFIYILLSEYMSSY